MPNVIASPRSNSNGEQVTEFLDTVNTTPATYTFPNTQNRLKIKNNGSNSLSLTVNGLAVTVLPTESKEFYGSIDSFVIASNGGVQSFEVLGTYHKEEEFQLTGSNVKQYIPILANTTDQNFSLPSTTREILLINDGVDVINFAFDGNPSVPIYPYANAAWTFSGGTWSTGIFGGVDVKYADNANNTNKAVCKPGKIGLYSITLDVLQGQGAGIAKIELSIDNGVNWLNPSDIVGVSRSDGALTTAMNVFDLYANIGSQAGSVTYTLPINFANTWAIRVSATNTKNAAANATTNIFIADIKFTDASVFPLKASETISLGIQTTKINFSSPTSSSGRAYLI